VSRQLVNIPQAVEQRPWLTERFLRRLVAKRRIPYHKVGGRVLFDLADLDALAEQGRVEPVGAVRLAGRRAG
jgi:excisionase family DNA binding protein